MARKLTYPCHLLGYKPGAVLKPPGPTGALPHQTSLWLEMLERGPRSQMTQDRLQALWDSLS